MSEVIDTSQWIPETLPTQDRLKKGDIDIIHSPRGGISIRSRNFDDPLRYYTRNGFISITQGRAGCKFHKLFFFSGMKSQYVISRYTEVRGGEAVSLEEVQEEYRLAREAIRGIRQKEVCFNVCCLGEKAGRTGRRGNLSHLKDALDDLIKHFGYDKD